MNDRSEQQKEKRLKNLYVFMHFCGIFIKRNDNIGNRGGTHCVCIEYTLWKMSNINLTELYC